VGRAGGVVGRAAVLVAVGMDGDAAVVREAGGAAQAVRTSRAQARTGRPVISFSV
jgi:hypothetical protein